MQHWWSGLGLGAASGLHRDETRRGLTKTQMRVLGAGLLAAATAAACGPEGTAVEGEDVDEASYELVTPVTVSFQNGVSPTSAYAGMVDSTIRQAAATTNYGAATTCEADGDDGSGVDKSCLLQWALSGIPSGSTVQSATITLRITDASSNTYNLYELKRAWNESQVTWNKPNSATNWATAGALGATDRGSIVGSITGSVGSKTVTLNAAGIAMVQGWVSGSSNSGIAIADASVTNGIDFASSEHATVSYHPILTITYLPPDTGTGGGSGTGGSTGGTGGATGGAGGSTGGTGGGTATEPNLLVAFIGDQGNGSSADAVLNLIKAEGAQATVHNGDFDYASNPTAFDNRVTNILGASYPYFAVIGNHDAPAWGGTSGYGAKIAARVARVPSMQCTGNLGVQSDCYFKGLHLIQSCVGTSEYTGASCGKDSATQVAYIRDRLAADNSIWSVCSWHKNQNDMQVGTKGDEAGWNAYKECMNGGAIVSTGHEHSYARTLTLTNLGNTASGHGAVGAFNLMELGAGKTFVFVSGLGGNSVRAFDTGSHNDDTWWSSYYTSDRWFMNGVMQSGTGTHGALFIRFNVNGDPKKASAYFKDINGRLVDSFTIQAQ